MNPLIIQLAVLRASQRGGLQKTAFLGSQIGAQIGQRLGATVGKAQNWLGDRLGTAATVAQDPIGWYENRKMQGMEDALKRASLQMKRQWRPQLNALQQIGGFAGQAGKALPGVLGFLGLYGVFNAYNQYQQSQALQQMAQNQQMNPYLAGYQQAPGVLSATRMQPTTAG